MVEYHMPAAYESVLLFLGGTNLAFPIRHGSPRRKEVRWYIFSFEWHFLLVIKLRRSPTIGGMQFFLLHSPVQSPLHTWPRSCEYLCLASG
jgi:hypothetical protein